MVIILNREGKKTKEYEYYEEPFFLSPKGKKMEAKERQRVEQHVIQTWKDDDEGTETGDHVDPSKSAKKSGFKYCKLRYDKAAPKPL